MHTCMHTQAHVYTRRHMGTQVHKSTQTDACTHSIRGHTHAHKHRCVHTCTQAQTHACRHMSTHAHKPAHTHACTYAQKYTQVCPRTCADASGLTPCSPECLRAPAHASPGSAGPLGLGPHPAPSTSSQHPRATCPRSTSPCPATAAIFQTTLPPSDSESPGGKMVFDQAPLSSVQHKLPYKNRYK